MVKEYLAHTMKKEIQMMVNKTIKIKYFTDKIDKINKIDKGDWIDLRAAQTVELKKGEFKLIPLGVAMQLPEGYEAHVVPRSSTFKNFGIIQTNHQAVIDESYCGDNDQWWYPVYALRNTTINTNDRICQFRIMKKQPIINFKEVEVLGNNNRGGIGSTGRQQKGMIIIQKILKSKDVKDYLGIASDKTLYKLFNTKGFPQFKIGRDYYIPEDDFKEWISKNAKMNTKIII